MHDVNAGDAAPVWMHHDDLRYCLYLLVVKMHVYNVLIKMMPERSRRSPICRVCTLMVKRRSSIYARTFSRPFLDLYNHSQQEEDVM
jgi:hypothetical protein